ncbi:VIT family protein [Tabrizicola sp.]|uniref:VIT1/CCC1 transporter family protein n=1 Tax=Tabrizicola sp. TaxID=2005166 RepID=UPI0025CFA078|nr:VIT family protein [Tabrizicola sp.]MBY0351486.1 VIT family protein [Tabrizicola sp.]
MERNHREEHYVARVGWLRAAVLGANDGIVSTASLIVGVAAASGKTEVLIAGMAGMVAGALSMAAGEYVSVSSQADTEKADITREAAEIAADPEEERRALADIYERRGLTPKLAAEVAAALHAKDALGAHVREELGISEHTEAKPLAAAGASSLTFAVGAALPLVTAALAPEATITLWVTVLSLIFLALLGAVGAKTGGASIWRGMVRVTFWGAVAMAVTALVGKLFGAVV